MEPTTPDGLLLWCDMCNRGIHCARADGERYTRDGWPKCCGETMVESSGILDKSIALLLLREVGDTELAQGYAKTSVT